MPLERFFDAMGPFLEGTSDAEALVRELGPSPSGVARLELYAELVRRQRRDVLDGLFSAVRAACDRAGPSLWDDIARGFTCEHPPRHYEPNHFGLAMSDYLVARRGRDASQPAYLEELADYQVIKFLTGVCDVPMADEPALERGMFLRRYEHDVVSYVEALGTEGAPPAPTREPTTVLVCWSHTQYRVMTLRVSLAALGALARRQGRPCGQAIAEAAIDSADDSLVSLGVLAPKAA